MEHKWEDYFDTESEYWEKVQKIYKENDSFPKIIVKNRNLHHKFPRSFSKKDGIEIDNDKDNLVSLSLSDHFLVHYYLWKSCNKKGYRRFMATAFQFMRKKAIRYATDETIEMLAKDYAEIMKDVTKGRKVWNKGKHLSEETKKNMSQAQKGKKHGPLSDEHKIKLSKAHKGIWKGKHWKLVDGKRVWY